MIPLPHKAQEIIDILEKNGFKAYAVGGSVRDVIMGKPTKGWDFTTDATPQDILSLFPDGFYDNDFGTVCVKIYNPDKSDVVDIYEITTFRSEQGYTDRRHPDTVIWGKNLEEDLSRRDFTINAIAYDGESIFDPFAGTADIDHKIIRAVGNAQDRFREDALRMMRAIRIAAQLGFTIEGKTFAAIESNAPLIQEISRERVRDELLKILASDFASDGILILKNSGLLKQIIPELDEAFDVEQKSPKRHHMYDVGMHSVMALKHCPSPDPIVRLATLLHDVGKPKTAGRTDEGVITFYNHEVAGAGITKSIVERLRLSKKDAGRIITLVRWHQFSVDERQTDSAIRRIIRKVGKENLDDMLALRIGDRLGGGARETSWRLELFKKRLEEVQKQPFSVADLKVNGHDVMEIFGCKPGPIIGKTLETIFSQVEEGTLPNQRDAQLAKIKEIQDR